MADVWIFNASRKMAMYSENREKTRINIELQGELHTADGNEYSVKTGNISFSGAQIDSTHVGEKYLGQVATLKLVVPYKPDPVVIEFQVNITHNSEHGAGLQFINIDINRYKQFEALLYSKAEDGDKLLQELNSAGILRSSPAQYIQEEMDGILVSAVKSLFSSMLNGERLQVENAIFICADDEDHRHPMTEVTGVIKFNGSLSGGVHLAAPMDVALHLASSFDGEEEFTCIKRGEAADAFGELTNIIAGDVKTILDADFEHINLTPPSIITGNDYGLCYMSNLSCIRQYFSIDKGRFFVDCFLSI